MNTKFTAGPWSFVPSVPEEGVECYWIQNGVQFVTSVDGPQNDEREANARLMAAAPELFQALLSARTQIAEDRQGLLNGHMNFSTGRIDEGDDLGKAALALYDQVLSDIDAAIAKATGDAT